MSLKPWMFAGAAILAIIFFVPVKWILAAAVVSWVIFKLFWPRYRYEFFEFWKNVFTGKLKLAVANVAKASGIAHTRNLKGKDTTEKVAPTSERAK